MGRRNLLFTALNLTLVVAGYSGGLQAQDGELGVASTGKVGIALEVNDSVKISALDSLDFGTYGGSDSGNLSLSDDFCVYVNGGDQYTITPISANAAFKLVGSTFGDEIEYTVHFKGAPTGAEAAPATAYSSPTTNFPGSVSLNCDTATNASLGLSIAEQAMRDASTDTYSDTLILVVNPI